MTTAYEKYHAKKPLPNVPLARSREQIRERGIFGALHDSYLLDTSVGQATIFAATANAYGVAWSSMNRRIDPDYSPFLNDNLTGYEDHIEEFIRSTSREETMMIKQMIENNRDLRAGIEDFGITRFAASILDPINLVPVGRAAGLGFAGGMRAIALPGTATLAVSEAVRHKIDPTSTYMETVTNVIGGALFMGLMGGAMGKIDPKKRMSVSEALNRMTPPPGQTSMFVGFPFFKGGGNLGKMFKRINSVLKADIGQKGLFVSDLIDQKKFEVQIEGDTIDVKWPEVGPVVRAMDVGDNTIQVFHTGLPESARGKGIATAAYKRLISWAEKRGKRVISDRQVSPDAQKIYARLKDEGYNVIENPHDFDQNGIRYALKGYEGPYEIGKQIDGRKISDEVRVRHEDAKLGEKIARENLEQIETDLKALHDELPNKVKEGGARTKHKQKIAEQEKEWKQAKADLRAAESNVADTNTEMAFLLDEKTIKDWDLLPTGYNKILGKLNEFPWWRIIRTDLRELSPELAARAQIFAFRMAGTPGLNNLGNTVGASTGVSVEYLALVHHGGFTTAAKTHNKIYMKYLGYGDTNNFQAYVTEATQRVRRRFGARKSAIEEPRSRDDKMDKVEFDKEVSIAVARNGDHPEPAVREAAKEWAKFLDDLGEKGRQRGIFATQRNLTRKIEKLQSDLDEIEAYEKANGKDAVTPEMQTNKLNGLIELDQATKQLEAYNAAQASREPGQPGYIHRVWLSDQVAAKKDELIEMIYQSFTQDVRKGKAVFYIEDTKYVIDNADPAAIRGRAEEAYNSIVRDIEAGYDDLFRGDPNNRRDLLEHRKAVIINELGPNPKLNPNYTGLGAQLAAINNKLARMRDGKPVGSSSALVGRKLDLDDQELIRMGVIEGDPMAWAGHYVTRLAPLIETSAKFGDWKAERYLADFFRDLNEEIKKARGNDAKVKRLRKEMDELATAMTDLRDIVQGYYQIPDDPSALTGRALRFLRNFNIPATMGKSVTAAFGDTGNIILSQGFTRSFRYGLEKFRSGILDGNIKLIDREVELAGSVTEVLMGMRYHQLAELGPQLGTMSKWERGASHMAQKFFLHNLLGPWTDMARRFAGGMAQSEIMRNSLLWRDGKLSKAAQTKMSRLGINEQVAKQFADEWEASGSLRHKDMFIANTSEWVSEEARMNFRGALNTEIMRMVPTPGAVDKPKTLLKSEWWKVVGQYRGFSIGATHRIYGAAMHTPGGAKYAGIASMIGIAFMSDLLFRRPDYIDMPLEEQIFRAVELSGVTGIILDLNDTIERASAGAIGVRPTLGMDIRERNPNWANQLGTIGSVPNQWLTLMYAFMSEDAVTNDKARAIRYMIPYNNLLYWNDFVTRMQRNTVRGLEEWNDD